MVLLIIGVVISVILLIVGLILMFTMDWLEFSGDFMRAGLLGLLFCVPTLIWSISMSNPQNSASANESTTSSFIESTLTNTNDDIYYSLDASRKNK